jgi:hypothetical protein
LNDIAPVKTICMEGAPLSRWDNRELWAKGESVVGSSQSAVGGRRSAVSGRQPAVETQFSEPGTRNPESGTRNYRDYDIIGEPYFDLDFTQVLYLTDTGRRWDGKASVRDKVQSSKGKVQSESSQLAVGSSQSANQSGNREPRTTNLIFRTTRDLICAAHAGLLPDQIMFTFHPQRWTDRPLPWLRELVMQNVKNIAKRLVLRFKF